MEFIIKYPFTGPYHNGSGITKVERMYLLSMMNVINDQGFEEWQKLGATVSMVFQGIGNGIYRLSFDGCKLSLILDSNELKYYLHYEEREVDMFLMDSWDKIEGFIAGTFSYNPLEKKQ